MKLYNPRTLLTAALFLTAVSALPMRGTTESKKMVQLTLSPHCTHATETPSVYCITPHAPPQDSSNTTIATRQIPEHAHVERHDAAGQRLRDPLRDENGEIIVGPGDGRFTQNQEDRDRLTKEEQKERDQEAREETEREKKEKTYARVE